MNKVLAVLAVFLMASPVMAVTLSINDAGGGELQISYDATADVAADPNKLPRAFALSISVSEGIIASVDTTDCEPFDIYPGTIIIDGNGVVTFNGTPSAPETAPDNPGQPGVDASIVVEMGSLYHKGVEAAPAASGRLINVTVSQVCNITVCEEDTYRGGVVLEDGTSADVACAETPPVSCFPVCACWLSSTQCNGDIAAPGGPGVGLGTEDFFPFKDAYGTGYCTHPYGTGVGEYNPCADLDRDGEIGTADFFEFKDRYTGLLPPPPGNCNTLGDETWPPPCP